MGKSHIINNEKIEIIKGIFEAYIKVFRVEKNTKFPEGIKLKCVLPDIENNIPILLLDNHEPFGYHLHSKLPKDKNFRENLDFKHYEDAIKFFLDQVNEVIKKWLIKKL